jgi:hypothetical protein
MVSISEGWPTGFLLGEPAGRICECCPVVGVATETSLLGGGKTEDGLPSAGEACIGVNDAKNKAPAEKPLNNTEEPALRRAELKGLGFIGGGLDHAAGSA